MTIDFTAEKIIVLVRIGTDPSFAFRPASVSDIGAKQGLGYACFKNWDIEYREEFNTEISILKIFCFSAQTDGRNIHFASTNSVNGCSQAVKILQSRNTACHRVEKIRQLGVRTRPTFKHQGMSMRKKQKNGYKHQ